MSRRVRSMLVASSSIVGAAMIIALAAPHELEAEQTVGHQSRAARLRSFARQEPPRSITPPLCKVGQVSTDRKPCVGANGRLDYSGD